MRSQHKEPIRTLIPSRSPTQHTNSVLTIEVLLIGSRLCTQTPLWVCVFILSHITHTHTRADALSQTLTVEVLLLPVGWRIVTQASISVFHLLLQDPQLPAAKPSLVHLVSAMAARDPAPFTDCPIAGSGGESGVMQFSVAGCKTNLWELRTHLCPLGQGGWYPVESSKE